MDLQKLSIRDGAYGLRDIFIKVDMKLKANPYCFRNFVSPITNQIAILLVDLEDIGMSETLYKCLTNVRKEMKQICSLFRCEFSGGTGYQRREIVINMSPSVSLSLMLSEAVAFYDPVRSDDFKAVNTVAV